MARPLIAALVLMSESNFYDLTRRSTDERDTERLVETLTDIWLRTLRLS